MRYTSFRAMPFSRYILYIIAFSHIAIFSFLPATPPRLPRRRCPYIKILFSRAAPRRQRYLWLYIYMRPFSPYAIFASLALSSRCLLLFIFLRWYYDMRRYYFPYIYDDIIIYAFRHVRRYDIMILLCLYAAILYAMPRRKDICLATRHYWESKICAIRYFPPRRCRCAPMRHDMMFIIFADMMMPMILYFYMSFLLILLLLYMIFHATLRCRAILMAHIRYDIIFAICQTDVCGEMLPLFTPYYACYDIIYYAFLLYIIFIIIYPYIFKRRKIRYYDKRCHRERDAMMMAILCKDIIWYARFSPSAPYFSAKDAFFMIYYGTWWYDMAMIYDIISYIIICCAASFSSLFRRRAIFPYAAATPLFFILFFAFFHAIFFKDYYIAHKPKMPYDIYAVAVAGDITPAVRRRYFDIWYTFPPKTMRKKIWWWWYDICVCFYIYASQRWWRYDMLFMPYMILLFSHFLLAFQRDMIFWYIFLWYSWYDIIIITLLLIYYFAIIIIFIAFLAFAILALPLFIFLYMLFILLHIPR